MNANKKKWYTLRDSNSRPSVPQTVILGFLKVPNSRFNGILKRFMFFLILLYGIIIPIKVGQEVGQTT